MTEWVEVLVAMTDGPRFPVTGVVRPDVPTEHRAAQFGWVGERPVVVGLDESDVRMWRHGAKLRVDAVDGTPIFRTDGDTAWRFDDDPACPLETPASRVVYIGPGESILQTPRAHDWLRSDDFTRPTSRPITTVTFMGRRCWEVELAPPPHKPYPIQWVVDIDTGVVVQMRCDAAVFAISYLQFDRLEDITPAHFAWNGPVTTIDQDDERHRITYEQQQHTKLEWFHQSVTAEPLTTRVPVDLSVTVVRSHDDDGSFTAHLGSSRAVTGNLARRPRSTTEWDLGWGGEIHRWTTRDYDWALMLHGLPIDEPALAELKTKLHANIDNANGE